MTNGALIKMRRGKETVRFWVFKDGTVQEYTDGGRAEVSDFISRYRELQSMGFREV